MMTLITILLICILLAVLSLNPKINIWAEIRGLLGLLLTVVIFGGIVLAAYWVWKRYPEEVLSLISYGLIVYGVYYVFRKPINKAWVKYQEKKARNRQAD